MGDHRGRLNIGHERETNRGGHHVGRRTSPQFKNPRLDMEFEKSHKSVGTIDRLDLRFQQPPTPQDARVHAVAHMVSSTFAEGELIPGAERHEKFSIS